MVPKTLLQSITTGILLSNTGSRVRNLIPSIPIPISLLAPPTAQVSSAVPSLILSGGASNVVANYATAAADYFTNVRTPASLIVGASIGALFADCTKPRELAKRRNRTERLCVRMYNVCVMMSFMLSLNAIMTATTAGVMILHADFDPMATTAYELLYREFNFEFLTVRLSYLLSLLTFIVGVVNRALLEYNLLRHGKGDMALALVFTMGGMVLYLASYVNQTLYASQNLFTMALQVFATMIRRAVFQHTVLQVASFSCTIAGVVFFVRSARTTIEMEDKKEEKGPFRM